MKVDKVYLEGEKDKVPRTKVIERSNADGAGPPVVNRQTLFYEDRTAHRLYYSASDGFLLGARNHLASWRLDPISDGRSRMTITSTFDVIAPGNVDMVRDTAEAGYEMIFSGLNRYLPKRGTPEGAHGLSPWQVGAVLQQSLAVKRRPTAGAAHSTLGESFNKLPHSRIRAVFSSRSTRI